jgi:diguanylate cyclase (GGDEF)-like protein
MRDGKRLEMLISMRHKMGHRVPVQLWTAPIRTEGGTVLGAAESFEEILSISDWDRRQSKLDAYGCVDHATGTLTHSMVQSHLRECLGTFAEHPVPFSVLCIEIDQLERLAKRDGPRAVASVLRVVGQTLENSLRPTDFLGRWKESQFLAILTECSANEILRAAERLRKMVTCSEMKWWGERVPLTISLGGSSVNTGDTLEGIIQRVESAVAEGVSQGGNRVIVRNE